MRAIIAYTGTQSRFLKESTICCTFRSWIRAQQQHSTSTNEEP